MILGYSDARRLSTAVLAAADLAQRHGANLNPKILHLAAQIHSATGHSEPVRPTFEDTTEYEQITTASAAKPGYRATPCQSWASPFPPPSQPSPTSRRPRCTPTK